jgi:pimeloyl-ACP methyl ester carboxylesterase
VNVEGTGPVAILVPGIQGGGELFYQQVPKLAVHYRVITYRLRDDATSFDVLAADLRTIVDQYSPLAPVLLIGESFGGAVALSFALRYADRVERLVILNSFPYFAPQFRLQLASVALRLVPWRMMWLVRHLTAFRLHSRYTHRAEIKRFIALTTSATRNGYLNRLRLLRSYDVRNELQRLRVPVLFLAATDDHLVPSVAQARLMAERAPDSSIRLLDGHGHICLIAPDLDLAAIVGEWRAARSPVAASNSAADR